MKNKISKTEIVVWILSVVPLLLVAAVYGKLPEMVPTNWGFDNQVKYESKSVLWMIAGMAPLIESLLCLLPKIDPKKRNYEKFKTPYLTFQMVMQMFLIVMTGIIVVEGMRPGTVNVSTVVCALCGILFIIIGNMMPKFRQNFFCGIKTPWTLSSETVWMKTNRLGGRMMFAAGFLVVAGAFLPDERWKMAVLFVPLMAAAIIPMIMSYLWFRKETGKE